jgi:acyl-CoA thioesterase YciA
MHRVQEDEGAGVVRHSRQFADVVDRADRVGGAANRQQPHARPEQPGELVAVEGAVLGAKVDEPDLRAGVAGGEDPRPDVGVVVEPRHQDAVARPQRPRDRPAQVEGEAGHVLPEHDLVGGRRVEQVGGGAVGLVQDRVGRATRRKDPAVVGVRLGQVASHRLDHPRRHLRAARPVEEDRRPPGHRPVEGGELLAERGDVEHGITCGRRGTSRRSFLRENRAKDIRGGPRRRAVRKTVRMSEPYLALQVLMMPRDTNGVPTSRADAAHPQLAIFGGVILGYIDQAGALGGRHEVVGAGGELPLLLTVAFNRVEFKAPVLVGDVVRFRTRLVRMGRTSITMHVQVEAERGLEVFQVTEAEVVYVGVDVGSTVRRPKPLLGDGGPGKNS